VPPSRGGKDDDLLAGEVYLASKKKASKIGVGCSNRGGHKRRGKGLPARRRDGPRNIEKKENRTAGKDQKRHPAKNMDRNGTTEEGDPI